MFTGIVQARGAVAAIETNAFGRRLVIDTRGWRPAGVAFAPGESVCVGGVCLTVVSCDAGRLSFDVIAETLAKTTLGELRAGSEVNLEPSLTPTTAMSGHFVQGHVDGVGEVTGVVATPQERRMRVGPPSDLMDYLVPQGSVTIDGVSLTIAAVGPDWFEVALIPTTLSLTTLGRLTQGDRVNLEADILAKSVVHYLRRRDQPVQRP